MVVGTVGTKFILLISLVKILFRTLRLNLLLLQEIFLFMQTPLQIGSERGQAENNLVLDIQNRARVLKCCEHFF